MAGTSQSIAHDLSPELVATAVPASTSTPPPLPEESVNSGTNPFPDSDIKQRTRRLSSFTPGRDSWVTEQLQFYIMPTFQLDLLLFSTLQAKQTHIRY